MMHYWRATTEHFVDLYKGMFKFCWPPFISINMDLSHILSSPSPVHPTTTRDVPLTTTFIPYIHEPSALPLCDSPLTPMTLPSVAISALTYPPPSPQYNFPDISTPSPSTQITCPALLLPTPQSNCSPAASSPTLISHSIEL